MKKTIYRAFAGAGMSLMVILMNACLKDADTFTDFGTVGNTVEFLDEVPGKSSAVSIDDPTSSTPIKMTLRVHQAGPYATDQDLTCTLGFSQAGVDLYNRDASHVPGTALPTDAYTFPSTVTIKAGKDSLGNANRTASFELQIIPNKVPTTPGVNYVLALGVTSVSPETTVSANNGVILFNFYKNPYDGSYHRTGTLVRQGNPPDAIDEDGDLVTVNATTSFTLASFFGNPALSFFVVVNADNSVTINSDPDASVAISGDGVNTYDPATKTFVMKYKYNNGTADRNFDEVWVHN